MRVQAVTDRDVPKRKSLPSIDEKRIDQPGQHEWQLTSTLPVDLKTAEGFWICSRSLNKLLPKPKYKNVSLAASILSKTIKKERSVQRQQQSCFRVALFAKQNYSSCLWRIVCTCRLFNLQAIDSHFISNVLKPLESNCMDELQT